MYLTCSKTLTCSQVARRTNRKIKEKRTKNKSRSIISPVRSHDHEGSSGVEEVLRLEGFVAKVGFEPGVKEWMMRVMMMTEMG